MTNVRKNRAFALSELATVVIILGILAALVVPQFSNASIAARSDTLRARLAEVRTSIDHFQADHRGHPPQFLGFWPLLTGKSDPYETAVAAGCGTACGPYLSSAHANPLNGLAAISSRPEPDTTAGWYYCVQNDTPVFLPRDSLGEVLSTY